MNILFVRLSYIGDVLHAKSIAFATQNLCFWNAKQ